MHRAGRKPCASRNGKHMVRSPVDALSLITAEPLSSTSDTPLYQQLEDRLLQLIASGSLGPETPLPTELELCRAFGLSRATVRRCFADLVDEGRVVRRRGQGTFVAPQATRHAGPFLNFSQRMAAAGLEPSSRTLSLAQEPAPADIAQRLGRAPGAPVWRIRRLRLADGRPMTIDTAYVPVEVAGELTPPDLDRSLYALIAERTGVLPARADEVFGAVSLTDDEARDLAAKPGAAALLITRTTYDAHDAPFEVSVTLAPGDRNRYEFSSRNGSR